MDRILQLLRFSMALRVWSVHVLTIARGMLLRLIHMLLSSRLYPSSGIIMSYRHIHDRSIASRHEAARKVFKIHQGGEFAQWLMITIEKNYGLRDCDYEEKKTCIRYIVLAMGQVGYLLDLLSPQRAELDIRRTRRDQVHALRQDS